MERRTAFLASVGALSLVACGGEPEEAYGELQQAATITPSLLITRLTYSGTTLMKLTVQVLPDVYLRTIVLARGASGAATTGKLVKGTAARPGLADVTISAELFDDVYADSKVVTMTIEVEYNGTVVKNLYFEHV
jgi:hypothetical protein